MIRRALRDHAYSTLVGVTASAPPRESFWIVIVRQLANAIQLSQQSHLTSSSRRQADPLQRHDWPEKDPLRS